MVTRRQHFTVDRPRRMQFSTRVEGLGMARRVWTCQACRLQHAAKPEVCRECGGVDFWKFDSQKEADRYATLALWQDAGIISGLTVHPVFTLNASRWIPDPADPEFEILREEFVGRYIADFIYWAAGALVVEDVKASASKEAIDPVFAWKARHVAAQYGIEIKAYT